MSVSTASPIVACRTPLPPGAPRVRITATDDGQQKVWNLNDPVTLIGWGENCAIQLVDTSMSKIQCLIVNTGTHVLIRDLHSPKPTLLNSEPTSLAVLANGHVIRAGKIDLHVHIRSAPPADAEDLARILKLPGTVTLKDTQTTRHVQLNNAVALIGRRPNLDIPLDDADVSPAHAAVFAFAERPLVLDLGSRKGIAINGEPRPCCELKHDDRLRIGPFEVIVQLKGWKEHASALPFGVATDPSGPEPDVDSTSIDSLLTSTGCEAFEGFEDLRNMVSTMKREMLDGRDLLAQWEKDLQVLIDQALAGPPRQSAPKPDRTSDQLPSATSAAPKPPSDVPDRKSPGSAPAPSSPPPQAPAQSPAKPRQAPAEPPAPVHARPAKAEAVPTPTKAQPDNRPPAAETTTAAAPAQPGPARRAADNQAVQAALIEHMPRTTKTADGKTVVNSLDLDPDVAQKLRLMRRLEPTTDEVELLRKILEKETENEGKSGKKKSWWRR